MSQKILITGSTGLLGSNLIRRFLTANFEVFALIRPNSDKKLLADIVSKINFIEGDILDVLALEQAIQQVDFVVHAAAMVSFAPKDRFLMQKINVEGTANVVNICLTQNIKKLCFVSSIAALGRPSVITEHTQTTISEKQKWEESPLNSNYAKTKYLAECEVWRGIAEGLNAVIVNPSIILGEGDLDKSSTQLFNYVLKGNKYYTQGFINYVDVVDVADAIFQLVESPISAERFILNGGKTSYKAFFESVALGFGVPAPNRPVSKLMAELAWRVEAVRSWLTGKNPLITKETAKSAQSNFYYDSTKIKQALGFNFKPLQESIDRISNPSTTLRVTKKSH